MTRNGHTVALLILLLAAAGMRLVALDDAPPGVTHDEADHALDAWRIVEGNRPVYLTTGYGREPLYDYATAGVMALIGRNVLAPRVTAAFFGLLLVAATYAWTRRLFSPRIALLHTGLIALSFWPLMVSRHALRTITLPALLTVALALFLYGLRVRPHRRARRPWWETAPPRAVRWHAVVAAGLLLGLTFYTYIPARVLWLLFPLLGVALWLRHRPVAGRPGTRVQHRHVLVALAGVLLIAAAVALPLANYLRLNPQTEVRINQLSAPLRAAEEGNWTPLLENARETVLIFTVEGDTAWRYNIPGRPLLPGVLGPLFYLGLLLALWGSWRHPGRLLVLAWLAAGSAPSLITGPFLSTTQAVGLLPVLFLFPALTVDLLLRPLGWVHPRERRLLLAGVPLLLFGWLGATTARAYFDTWATHPQVRVQYETTLVETIRYLNEHGPEVTALSTTTPRPLFSPAVAALYRREPAGDMYWFDGRGGFFLPPGERATVTFDAFAPPLPVVAELLGAPEETLSLEPEDVNRPVTIHTTNGAEHRAALQDQFALPAEPADFGGVTLAGFRTVENGSADQVIVDVLWVVTDTFDPEAFDGVRTVHFLHLLDGGGTLIGQSDRLEVPSTTWAPGAIFFQRHRVSRPAWDGAAGGVVVGMYVCHDEACTDSTRVTRRRGDEPAGTSAPLLYPTPTDTP